MNGNSSGGADRRPAEAMQSIAWPDYSASLNIGLKTRRAVRDAVISNEEQRDRKLRTIGVALTGFLSLLVLLGPVIWNYTEDVIAGEHLFDFHAMVHALVMMLFPAMLAALLAAMWKGKKHLQRERGGVETFRPRE
jgi:hypothetical protein